MTRIASLSPELPGLPYDCSFSFHSPGDSVLESWTVFYFALFPLSIYMLFSCPVTSIMIPDALLLILSSKYSLSFFILNLLIHGVKQKKLLIDHLA